ncbi:unnamed protein product, partial [Dicrocoelium dendriticum]
MQDDTAAFRCRITGGYEAIEQFQRDLIRFQRETASSFYRCTVITAEGHKQRTGKDLPDGYRYRFIQYRCVHSKRKNVKGKRYRCYNCEARFSVVLKGRYYEIGRAWLKHSHVFQLGKPWLYPANRRLNAVQEAAVLKLMKSFRQTREIRGFVLTEYGIRITRRDLYHLRHRSQKEQVSEVENVITMLESEGSCSVVRERLEVRFLFFVPACIRSLVARYGEVILADSTHQLNYGGYILWHCMFVDVTG